MTRSGREKTPASEEWLERLLALASEFACVIDAAGTVLAFNPRWHTDRPPASLFQCFLDDDRAELENAIGTAPGSLEGSRTRARLRRGEVPTEVRIGELDRERLLVTIVPTDPGALLASSMVRAAGTGLAVMDAEGRYRHVNDAYCEIYRHSREALLGQPFTMVVAPEQRETAMANHRETLEQGRGSAHELEVVRGDGTPMTIDTTSRRITLPDGEILRLATVLDITGIRDNERRLAEAESRLRDFTDSLPGAVYQFRHEPDGHRQFTYMSRGLHAIGGFDPDYPLDDFDTFVQLVPEEERAGLQAAIEHSERTLEPLDHQFRLLTPAGTLWVEARSAPITHEDGTVVCNGFIDDITARVEAQHALAEDRKLLNEIVETNVAALLITDRGGRVVHANPRARALLRLDNPERDSIRDLPVRLSEPDGSELARGQRPLRRVIDAGGPVEDMRLALHWEDGDHQILSVNGSPVADTPGEVERIVFSFTDLTRETEARLRVERQHALFQAIFKDSSEIMIVTDTERRMRMVNRAFTDIFGYSEEEVIGQPTRMVYANDEDHERIGRSYAGRTRTAESRARLDEARFRAKDGREFPAETMTDVLLDADGNHIGFIGFIRDITERKRTEAELERQRELYSSLVESTSAILWEADPETFAFTFVSGETENLLGYTAEDWTRDPDFWAQHIHDEDRAWATEYCRVETQKQRGHSFDYRMIAADGGTVWLRDIVTVLVADGRPRKLVGVMIDITETKAAEAELAKSERRYRELYNRTPVMLHSIDPEGRLLAVSGYWLHHLGYSEDQVIGRRSSDFLTEESREHAIEEVLPRFLETGECHNIPYRMVRADGSVIDVLLSATAEFDDAGNVERSLAVMTDVTEQRRAEQEYRDLFNNASEGIYRTSPDGRLLRANPALVAMHGFDTEAELLEALDDIATQWYIDPDERQRILDIIERDGRLEHYECRLRRLATGETIWISENAHAVYDEQGEIVHFEGSCIDISERKHQEQVLAQSEERFRTLYHNTPVMLFSADAQNVIVDVNEYWLEQLGYGRDEVIGHRINEFFTPASKKRAEAAYLPELQAHGSVVDQEYRIRCSDGEIREILLSSSLVYDDRGAVDGALSVLTDVTERRRLEAEFRDIFENTTEGMFRSTPEGRLLRANPALARLHGFATPEQLLAEVGSLDSEWYADPTAREEMKRRLEQEGYVDAFEAEIRPLNSDQRVWTSETIHATRDAQGRVLYYEGTVRDITAEYKARQMAEHRNRVLEMIARDDPVTGILYEIVGIAEQQQERLTAAIFLLRQGRLYSAAAPGLSNSCIEAIDGSSPSEARGLIQEAVHADREVVAGDIHDRPQGENRFNDAMAGSGYGAVMLMPIRDQEGTILGLLAGFAREGEIFDRACTNMLREMAQITSIAIEQHRLSEALMRQAQYDPLTDLPNRALLSDRLERAVRDGERAGHEVGVLLLDLDEFKLVNDSLGHSAGDELLKEVASRLQECLRGGDTVARLGGDEFVVIVPLQKGGDYCTDIAERILASLQRPVCVAEQEIAARPSMGVSIYPQDGRTPEALLKAADTAMYAAKHAGKNQYRYFAENMNRKVSDRLRIESELHDAIRDGALELHFQPRVSLTGGAICGAEGLLRWRHPEKGLLLPGSFIDIAERGPLIGEIDRLVIEQAMQQTAALQQAGHELVVSVNLSASELHTDGFAVQVARLLEESGVKPSGLELEITESMLMRDFERASTQLRELKERAPGLRIAIDDFGSGYSSLNYLRHLPVDSLKIDRSFVTGLAEGDETAAAIAKTIVELAHNLGMHVVAEGIEGVEQLRLLSGFGCEEGQGFLFDPALPIDEFRQRLAIAGNYADRISAPAD